jgi:class 3 adenylate cyclase
MKFLERIFFILFPLASLKGTPWEQQWHDKEQKDFYFVARVFFCITLFGYILHYYTVDRSEGLAPSELWFKYRFGMAAVSLLSYLFYWSEKSAAYVKYYRLPAIISGCIFIYFQTQTMLWYPKIPYLYSFAFIFVTVTVLNTSILKSIVVAIMYFVLIVPTLKDTGLSLGLIFSAGFFTIAIIIFARSTYKSNIMYFIEIQKNISQQKKFIEFNIEFTNQIKAFLPREISRRLNEFIQEKRMSVIQATDEVLRPKNMKVACLFSDIRDFTKNSSDLNGYVSKSMFPNVKALSLSIEKFRGIPRKVGDLLFAYYDFEDPLYSVKMAMSSAIEIGKINTDMNQGLPDNLKIKRFILLSYGEAIVGNLSGYDASIEITAIGKPVNFLSRLDEATKNEALKTLLQSGDIIIAEDMIQLVRETFPSLDFIDLDLSVLGIKIRDFENSKMIYVFRSENYKISFINTEEAA